MDGTAVASRVRISHCPSPKFECYTPGSIDEHFDLLFASPSAKRISQFFVDGKIRKLARDLRKAASYRDSRNGPKKGGGHPDLPHDRLSAEIGCFVSEINLEL